MGLPEPSATLNTIITGQICCGDKYLSAILCDHPEITCHSVLLDADDAVRRYYHEAYFGDAGNTPDWLVEGHISGEQYLTNKIFDNPLKSEEVIGVSVLYPHLYARDLWDYFSSWCRAGDFCVIQLKRNPVACFASLKMWESEGNSLAKPSITKFDRGYTEILGYPSPLPVGFYERASPLQLNHEELYTFIRAHAAADLKVEAMCTDRLEMTYEELILDFPAVCSHIFSFLDRECIPKKVMKHWSSLLNLRNSKVPLREVVANWSSICERAPTDIKPYLDPEAF